LRAECRINITLKSILLSFENSRLVFSNCRQPKIIILYAFYDQINYAKFLQQRFEVGVKFLIFNVRVTGNNRYDLSTGSALNQRMQNDLNLVSVPMSVFLLRSKLI
jgi:hypothetical protein